MQPRNAKVHEYTLEPESHTGNRLAMSKIHHLEQPQDTIPMANDPVSTPNPHKATQPLCLCRVRTSTHRPARHTKQHKSTRSPKPWNHKTLNPKPLNSERLSKRASLQVAPALLPSFHPRFPGLLLRNLLKAQVKRGCKVLKQ